ncbi:MAG TPA: GGDEF domain-containing protein [Xanthobacteraceae bacterium]|nr:GGDEF domain-containing protein [Xanthobacteraceae bacterium]
MHLDVQTLSVVTVFVTALLGALLVFAGLQNRTIRAPMWWGAAHVVNASGLGLLTSHGAAPDFVTNDLANGLVLLGYGLTWSGARIFDGREVRLLLVLSAPAIWIVLCRLPAFAANGDLGVIVVSTMQAVLALLTAEEFWRGRDEPLMSRWPMVIVQLANAAVLLARVPATLLSPLFPADSLMRGLSFALLAFGTLLFTVVMAFLQLNMTKERTELKHKINSLVDPLSGVANRRAFLDGATSLLVQQRIDREPPLALLLFDLDHFKQINDRFGHALGDAVLQTFAGTATATLGTEVLFARIGGEEFASCLPVGDLDEAYAIADRVRRNFLAAAAKFGNDELQPSVSVGITLGCDAHADVHDLLSVGDRALYRAKELGRNRVETEVPANIATSSANFAAPSIVPIIGPERAANAAGPDGERRHAAS